MNFDDLQDAWAEQAPLPLDPQALERLAGEECRRAELVASTEELGLATIFAGMAAIMAVDAWRDREGWASWVSAGLTLGIALFVLEGRRRRRRAAEPLGETLLGVVRAGRVHVDHQVARTRAFLLWFVLPSAAAIGVSMATTFSGRPLWVWLIQPIAILVFWVALRVELQRSHLPRRRRLAALEQQLVQAE